MHRTTKTHHPARYAALSCALVLLAGCATFRSADGELDAASRQVATGNVTLSADDADVPKAEITPQGDFLVAGEPAATTPAQRAELLAYRGQYIAVAREGIAIGQQGLEVGRRAMLPMAIAALFGASDDTIEASLHTRLAGVRKASEDLCGRLPRLREAQQRLASDLPAFQPYATLTQKDIDDCLDDVRDGFASTSTGNAGP